jgi:hypothetical protein
LMTTTTMMMMIPNNSLFGTTRASTLEPSRWF